MAHLAVRLRRPVWPQMGRFETYVKGILPERCLVQRGTRIGRHLDVARKILIRNRRTQQENSKWPLIPLGLQLTLNQRVEGSSPSTPTNDFNGGSENRRAGTTEVLETRCRAAFEILTDDHNHRIAISA